jgi:hypothetical protein
MPELEDQSYAQYSPFSDSEASDTEYTPEPTELTGPTEPGLEYDTSFSSEEEDEEEDDDDEEDDEESESESEVDEMANRGRPRKRAGSPRRGVREEPAAKVLERSLKESLVVALRVQELKKVAADNEKKRETPRWLSFMKKFLVLLLLFVAAFATVWVVNEVHYRGGLPYVKLFRGYVCSNSMFMGG